MNQDGEQAVIPAIRGHHWISGNLPLDSICSACGQLCGVSHSLADRRCCWCLRTSHDRCVAALHSTCDLGVYKVRLGSEFFFTMIYHDMFHH